MSRWYRIISPSEEQSYWRGDRAPEEDEIDEIVDDWTGGLLPMDLPQTVTDYLLVQRRRFWGWQTIRTIHLMNSLEASLDE